MSQHVANVEVYNCGVLDEGQWPCKVFAKKTKNSYLLELSMPHKIVRQAAMNRYVASEQACVVMDLATKDYWDLTPEAPFTSLQLVGVHPRSVFQGAFGARILPLYLSALSLQTCHDMLQTLELMSTRLTSLSIRHEPQIDPGWFQRGICRYLTSFSGLESLQVLLDYTVEPQDLKPILEVQGQSLRVLLWEERTGPRTSAITDTSLVSRWREHIKYISWFCPKLQALSLPFDYRAFDPNHPRNREHVT